MNKDLLFSHWYDSLEGTKSQGFAYKAWCAGWDASQKESTPQEISDIGQEIERPVKSYTGGYPQYATDDRYTKQENVYTSAERVQEIDILRQSEREGWRYAKECEDEIERLKVIIYEFENDDPPKPQNELDIADRAYFAGKEAGIAEAVKREWQGLTDEDIAQGAKESWVDVQAFESVAWWADAKLREKNT